MNIQGVLPLLQLSAGRLFQILVLKSGSHPVDFVLGDTMPGSLGSPFLGGCADLCGYFTGLGCVQLVSDARGMLNLRNSGKAL
jgi:hypothetical protein